MGEIIAKQVRGMNWMAKISIVLIFTLVFSTFMHEGWNQPKPAEAAVTFQSAGAIAYSASGGTTVAPAYPTPLAAGDLLVLIIGMKPSTANGGTVTTPTGWTPIASLTGAGGYGTTLAADTGNTNLFTYYHVSDGTETGTLTVTIGTNNISWAQIYRISKTLAAWDVAGATGSDTTGDATVSIAFGSNPGVTAGDFILGAMCIPTDVTTPAQFSAEAFTQTGVTFGAATEISEPDSTTGNQIGGFVVRAAVTAGTGSANPTMTATAAGTVTNVRGPGVFIRIREVNASTINTCAGCHQYAPTFADGTARNTPAGQFPGSHQPHVQGSGIACSVCHVAPATETSADFAHRNGTIQMQTSISGGSYTKGASFAQTNTPAAFTACTNTSCHGTNSGTWGTNTTNNTCTKCHGTPTATVDVTNRYVVAPPVNTAGTSGTLTGTGQVSNDAKVGAHQTHIRYLNGVRTTANDTNDDRCGYCHGPLPTSGNHANGSSNPNGAWSGLATHSGTMTPTYAGVTCTNTYCHNPAGTGGTLNTANAGTDSSPDWTNAAYIADGTLKTVANCGVCHKSPWDAGFTSSFAHGAMTTATACTGCHGHEGGTGGVAGQQHMDGIKYGGGSCNSCHGYEATSWATATERAIEGKGAHAVHIAHLATLSSTTLNPATDQFGSGASWTNVCGVCHNGATHTTGEAIGGNGRQISVLTTYQFGPAAPSYSGVPATSSSVNPKSCSNVSCHYSTTPVWSAY